MAVKIYAQVLPADMPSLAGGASGAPPGTIRLKTAQGGFAVPPPGTILVKAAKGGYAVPPRKFALHFGRATLDVHVPVGAGNQYISRLHGVFRCDGTKWQLRNEGLRPIQMLGEDPLLSGHEIVVAAGYTPLTIKTPHPRSHWVEVYVVGFPSAADDADSEATTLRPPVAYELSPVERLVITARSNTSPYSALQRRHLLQPGEDLTPAEPCASAIRYYKWRHGRPACRRTGLTATPGRRLS